MEELTFNDLPKAVSQLLLEIKEIKEKCNKCSERGEECKKRGEICPYEVQNSSGK